MTLFDDAHYGSASFPPPRAFQERAHEQLREGFRAGHRCQVLMAPTGAGKTFLGLRACHEALQRGKRAIFMCDRTTLIEQTSATADRYGLAAHGVLQASHWRTNLARPLQIASAQTLARRDWPEADLIVVDECFPGETLVSTPTGAVRIDSLRAGDAIICATGPTTVRSTFSSCRTQLLRVRLSDGTTFECTFDHPIFTDVGWRPACALGIGSRLFREQAVRELWGSGHAGQGAGVQGEDDLRGRSAFRSQEMLREVLRQEVEQPDALQRVESKDGIDAEGDWASAPRQRRERKAATDDSKGDLGDSWARVGDGVGRQDAAQESRRIPASLQTGSGESGDDDLHRTGRGEPWCSVQKAARLEEGCRATRPWVESVEAIEHPRGRTVYNLRVAGHPSYFANGILVHNCHTQLKAWTEHIPNTKAAVIGLSATPFSTGLGRLFTNLVNAATMHELTEQGILVPMRPFIARAADMRGAATAGGEWTDKAAEERGMEIIGDVVTEWSKHGQGRKTICFGSTIRHCEEICRQFNEAGVSAAVFTSETTAEQRAMLLQEYRKPDSHLRVLVSVEALAKGFDVQDVGCVIDCRPLRKSLSTAIQMWGRGLRSSPDTGKQDCIILDHSGNLERFAEDFSDIFFNGLGELDSGEKLDKAIRRDDEEKEAKACPSCGHRPFAKRCVACGFEIQAPAMVEHVPGELQEVRIGKRKLADDSRHLWEQVVTYARAHSAPDKQRGRAAHLYKDIMGTWPPKSWSFDATPNVEITRNVLNQIRSRNIAYVRARQKEAA